MTTGITDPEWLDAKVCELSDKLASANALNERLVKFVRDCAGTQGFGHTPLYVSEARALLADMGKGDGG